MPIRVYLNRVLDALVRPTIRAHGRDWPAFQVCGCTGLELAVLLAMGLVLHRGLSPWVMGAIIGSAVATFYAVAYATKIITGEERLTYYHHEIAVMTIAALLLWLLRQPLLGYLDATLLGVGMFLACGRVGCLMAGCCHGRPHRWGVRYRDEHAQAGFPAYYVGVRLFPIQAVESLWVFGSVLVGSAMVLTEQPPGAALAWYVVAYDVGRFCFEFARGDTERLYHGGFSEGQWISLILTCGVAAAEYAGLLPWHAWHIAAAAGLALVMLAVVLRRRRRGDTLERLGRPEHLREIADALASASAPDTPRVVQTSLGMCISAGLSENAAGTVQHYSLSSRQGTLSDEAASTLAAIVCQLRGHDGARRLVRSQHGVVHLLLYPAMSGRPTTDDPEPVCKAS